MVTRMLAVMGAVAWAACGGGGDAAPARVPGDRAPALTVEVLNASGRTGDARAATRMLRHAGIDVVYFGNAPATSENGNVGDSTTIVVRRGNREVGERIRAVLGVGRVEVRPDSGRLIDASVLLGADFKAPSAPSFAP